MGATTAGLCTVAVPRNSTYTVRQTGAPAGWSGDATLGAGTVSPSTVTARPYDTLSVTVGTANVTIPAAASNTDTSPTARSGT